MYEVYPDDKGQWILYEVGGGNFNVVAWFVDPADAAFAREAFMRRAAAPRSAGTNGTPQATGRAKELAGF